MGRSRSLDWTVFVAMAREEWRLHTELFGGARFALFPVFVTLAGAGAVWALVRTGTDSGAAVAGLHALVLLFGLYTGSLGLVGRDALRNVLGDVSLLVFSARTLPVSRARLLGIFVVKDVAYYAVLFLLPLTLAFATVLPWASLPLLFVALVATFALGIAVTFVLIGAASRGTPGRVAVLLGAAALGLAWVAGADPLSLTPYALYRAPLSTGALVSLGVLCGVALVGTLVYAPTAVRAARTAEDRFVAWHARLESVDGDGVLTKSLLDVARSSGGLWKVPASGALLFAVSAFLIGTVDAVTGIEPSVGVSYGAVMGLTAFTTYTLLTQFDSVDAYCALPISVPALFRAKRLAFLVLGTPTAVGYVLLAALLYGARPLEAAVGAVLAAGLSVYLFGLTVALTGFSPNEFLYDTLLFALFTAAVAVPLVPILIVGFVVVPVPGTLLVAIAVAAVALGGVGIALYQRAVPRWERRYRA